MKLNIWNSKIKASEKDLIITHTLGKADAKVVKLMHQLEECKADESKGSESNE